MQFKGKLMNETSENGKKKLILGPILAHLAQIWAPQNFFVGFIYTRCYTLLQAIIVGNFMRK